MIPSTSAPKPRLARPNLTTNKTTALAPSNTTRAVNPATNLALDGPLTRGSHDLFATPARDGELIRHTPPLAQLVSLQRLAAGPFTAHPALAHEARVPLVVVRLEEFVRFLVREEVENQCADRRRGADAVVEDVRVGWRGD